MPHDPSSPSNPSDSRTDRNTPVTSAASRSSPTASFLFCFSFLPSARFCCLYSLPTALYSSGICSPSHTLSPTSVPLPTLILQAFYPPSTMPSFSQAADLSAWKELQEHHGSVGRSIVLKECFEKDPKRFEKFSRSFENTVDNSNILFDFSKNFLTEETFALLVKLAKEAGIEELRDQMFAGEPINFTENRAVYHAALRNVSNESMKVDGKSVVEDVNSVLEHMKEFTEQVRSGEWKGYTGKKINTIVNIGIGGSDL